MGQPWKRTNPKRAILSAIPIRVHAPQTGTGKPGARQTQLGSYPPKESQNPRLPRDGIGKKAIWKSQIDSALAKLLLADGRATREGAIGVGPETGSAGCDGNCPGNQSFWASVIFGRCDGRRRRRRGLSPVSPSSGPFWGRGAETMCEWRNCAEIGFAAHWKPTAVGLALRKWPEDGRSSRGGPVGK